MEDSKESDLRDSVRALMSCLDDIVDSSTVVRGDSDKLVRAAEDLQEQVQNLYQEGSNGRKELSKKRKDLGQLQEQLDGMQETREEFDTKIREVIEQTLALPKSVAPVEPLEHLRKAAEDQRHALQSLQEYETQYSEGCERLEKELRDEVSKVDAVRSKLNKDRVRRAEESRRRQKWRTEVGSRLRISNGQLRDLQKETAGQIDMFEMRTEHQMDWQERGEAAKNEIAVLQPEADEAVKAVDKLEQTQKERAELAELLATLGRKTEYVASFTKHYIMDAAINEHFIRGLQGRMKVAGESIAALESELETVDEECAALKEEMELLREEKSALQTRLDHQQEISTAREQAIAEGSDLLRFVNGTLSRWVLDSRSAIFEEEADEDLPEEAEDHVQVVESNVTT